MATEKASRVDLFNVVNTDLASFRGSLSLIKDPYSGKYYGSDSYATVQNKINSAINYFNTQLNKPLLGNSTPYFSIGGLVDPVGDAKKGLAKLSSFQLSTKDQYIQKDMMLESFNAHPDGWDKYFEGSYKTPRETESNSYIKPPDTPVNSLAIPTDPLKTSKTVGTGITSAGSVNPFGQLDSGLNI